MTGSDTEILGSARVSLVWQRHLADENGLEAHATSNRLRFRANC